MRVKVKAFAEFREVMEKEIDLTLPEHAEISNLLAELTHRYPGFKEKAFESPGILKEFMNILRNGRNIQFIQELHTPLADGDLIALFPPVGGG